MIDVFPRSGMIKIGKQGENRAIRVILPNIRAGAGSILLLHQRSLDKTPYPVPVAETAEGIIWVVSATDTANQGRGQAELQWLGENGEIVKSVIYQTETSRSLSTPGAVPDEPAKPYVQAVARDAQSAQAAAIAAAQNAAAAETAKTSAEKSAQEAKAAQAKAEEAAQGVAKDREQIGANKSGLEAAQQELMATKEQLAETKAFLATTQEDLKKAYRAIQFQAELNKGQTWDFEEDTQAAYQRIVPSGAHAGAVMEWGGKIRKGYQVLLDDFPKSSLQLSVKKNGRYSYVLETLNSGVYRQTGSYQYTPRKAGKYTLHATINGPGGLIVRFVNSAGAKIGEISVYQSIPTKSIYLAWDFSKLQLVFIGNIGEVPVGTRTEISKIMLESGDIAHPWEPYVDGLMSAQVDEMRVVNSAGDSTDTYPIPAAVQALPGYGWSAGSVANTIERTENGWQYVQRVGSRAYQEGDELTDGTATYYALESPITTDITALMGDALSPFAVEAGGSITFHHPKADEGFAVDVPAKIQYITKLSEVSANG